MSSPVSFDFKGKRVLVTGGAGGLGAGIALEFMKSGAKVIVLDRDSVKLKKFKEDHPESEILCVDLLDWDESRKAVESVSPIHHLINNAAIPGADPFLNLTPDNIDKMLGINFKACINMSQVMAKHCPDGGSIVNISSIMDSRTIPGVTLYSCTKAALTMLTKCMALELGPLNIRVNCVRPTVMQTELLTSEREYDQGVAMNVVNFCVSKQTANFQRLLTIDETAATVLYLCSDAAAMINGTSIIIDGGAHIS